MSFERSFERIAHTEWTTVNKSDYEHLKRVEEAAKKAHEEWERWRRWCAEAEIDISRGSAPFDQAMRWLWGAFHDA